MPFPLLLFVLYRVNTTLLMVKLLQTGHTWHLFTNVDTSRRYLIRFCHLIIIPLFCVCMYYMIHFFFSFRVAPSGENKIKYFSFKHSWQVFFVGLNVHPPSPLVRFLEKPHKLRLPFGAGPHVCLVWLAVPLMELEKSDMCQLTLYSVSVSSG